MTAAKIATSNVARDALPALQDLRPTADTSAEIRAAFYRLVDAREVNQAEINRLDQARPGMLMSATAAEIERHDESIRKRKIFAEQLDVLEAELRRTFTVRKEAEEDTDFDARRAAIDAKVSEFNAAVLADYPAAAATIVSLLERERALLADYAELSLLPARIRRLNAVPLSVLTDGMQKGFITDGAPPKTLGAAVSLPGLVPGHASWPKPRPRAAQ